MLKLDANNIGHDSSYFMSPDTDGFYKVKVQRYFGLSQEVAGFHAALKGAGLKEMLDKEGRTWMILRTRMNINRIASWMDEYNIETWCQEGYRLYCPRCVRAYDKNSGELLFETQNLWVIMDMVKGRPERPSYIDSRLSYPDPAIRHFDPAFPKFPSPEEFEISEVFPRKDIEVGYFDSDYNRHVNNISYVNWMLEAFSPAFLDTHEPEFMDTEWKKQCHYGDKVWVETRKKEGSDEFYSAIMHLDKDGNEEIAFHAVSRWRKKVL